MLDFFAIREKPTRSGIEIYPDYLIRRSKDLMVKGKSFYAIWDEAAGFWSTDEYDLARLVDQDLRAYAAKRENETGEHVKYKPLTFSTTKEWDKYRLWVGHIADSSQTLDQRIAFAGEKPGKNEYISKTLPYALSDSEPVAYNELISVLYSPEEREKIEWAIGAVISGDSKTIQKFLVFYGEAGTGKSTVLNIIQRLFEGYYTTFEAKALTGTNNTFSTEVFRSNPLVAIQHDGDLSRIEDNTKLNSIISHEMMTMNEKFKPQYNARANCFLFMATNKPVHITDAKSGLIRRLIDVHPTGEKIPAKKFNELMSQINFELGSIAHHCLAVYQRLGKNHYNDYRPMMMILETDVFFNFVEEYYTLFQEQNGVSLSQAYELYKTFCDQTLVPFKLSRQKFRDQLKSYFRSFSDIARVDGKQIRSYYSGFLVEKFGQTTEQKPAEPPTRVSWLDLKNQSSNFDIAAKDSPAQYATSSELPEHKWAETKTKLGDLDTSKLHYVKLPENHIVIDFDLRDEKGEKSLAENLAAAESWPPTYAEVSKSGKGLHLHYIYDGDVNTLSSLYSLGIEIKVQKGDSSLRRMLSTCTALAIAVINSGLPTKGEDKVAIDKSHILSEKGLRTIIQRAIRKEYHPGTKPSVDFIYKVLEDMYASGQPYDVTDMKEVVYLFADRSTNHSSECVLKVGKMKFKSEARVNTKVLSDDLPITFFDVEVFPNLLVVSYMNDVEGATPDHLINPSAQDIELLIEKKLVGFNNRKYDNHILYARLLGMNCKQLFDLSRRIIVENQRNALFGEAYELSYTDVYDFSSEKKSLKKFQIDLGIHHQELGLPWDQPVSEELWPDVVSYCDNDVVSLRKVFHSRKEDFKARLIMAKLSGLSPNAIDQQHIARILFGDDQNPQSEFVYTDLSTLFPGYKFENGVSSYRGRNPGEGGLVFATPGFYTNVGLEDIASMHPQSIEELNLFGKYTKRYSEIKKARLAIKHKDFETAKTLLDGALAEFLENVEDSKSLAYALKIVLNRVYGLTSATFDNKFRDKRNIDNIVAKRGALFMINLQDALLERGIQLCHIKTDSVKIPNVTEEDIEFVYEYGKKYGYTFEHEAVYDHFCLVNEAVYIARYAPGQDKAGQWTATGAEFAHPYIFKTLFSHEPVTYYDLAEAKSVTTELWLNMGNEETPSYQFVGRVGLFCPVREGGGILLRKKDDKFYAVGGTKGYRWLEYEVIEKLGLFDKIDYTYYETLAQKAKASIEKYVSFDLFVEPNPELVS